MSETEAVRQSDTPTPIEVPRHAWPVFDPAGEFEYMVTSGRVVGGAERTEGERVEPGAYDMWTLKSLYDAHIIRPVGLVVKSTLSTAEENSLRVAADEAPFHVALAHALTEAGASQEDVGAAVAEAVRLELAEQAAAQAAEPPVSDSRTPDTEPPATAPESPADAPADAVSPDAAPAPEPAVSEAPAATEGAPETLPPRKLDPNRPRQFKGK